MRRKQKFLTTCHQPDGLYLCLWDLTQTDTLLQTLAGTPASLGDWIEMFLNDTVSRSRGSSSLSRSAVNNTAAATTPLIVFSFFRKFERRDGGGKLKRGVCVVGVMGALGAVWEGTEPLTLIHQTVFLQNRIFLGLRVNSSLRSVRKVKMDHVLES